MRIAVVVQRYGEEVIGGAERHSRLLAERLTGQHNVNVLTTCALDYRTWANQRPAGTEVINGVNVVRFAVARRRHWRYFGWKSKRLFSSPHRIQDEYRWVVDQGPECPTLLQYLKAHGNDFDAFLFFTYLYYPTVFGLPTVAPKAILVPTAHDEPAIHLDIFSGLFHLPRFIAYNTDEERRFVNALFHNEHVPSEVIGIGIDCEQPAPHNDEGYFLYAGRIENGKNCEELFEFTRRAGIRLKVIGLAQITVPKHIEYSGIVGEQEKNRLLARCRALILPSRNESLSLAVLEAWAYGKPVIVSAHSPILKAHVEKSGGGYCYHNYDDFRMIVQNVDLARGSAGRAYVKQNYSWAKVLEKYDAAFEFLTNGPTVYQSRGVNVP